MTMIDMHTLVTCTHSEHQPNPPCPPMQPSRHDTRMHACTCMWPGIVQVHTLAAVRMALRGSRLQ